MYLTLVGLLITQVALSFGLYIVPNNFSLFNDSDSSSHFLPSTLSLWSPAKSLLSKFIAGGTTERDTGSVDTLSETPFPKWLTDFTGLTEWPGFDPPYIPLDFIDFGKIPVFPSYSQEQCDAVIRESCSFDCNGCLEPDDIYTCPKLSQTFDDGPSRDTEELLKFLTHKTTFFTVGINVVSHPKVYRKILDEGHLIGSHTWSHPYLPELSNERIIAQLEWSIWAMNATGNHYPKYFRPPYGGIDNRVRAISRQFGLQAVLWDYDTVDWQLGSSQERNVNDILNDVKSWKGHGRGLILEHDGSPTTVEAGLKISDLIGNDQLTVAQCVGGIDYIKHY